MANQIKNKTIDVHALKQARPDLWPQFINTLQQQAPHYYAFINSDNVSFLKEQYGGELLIELNALPAKAQFMVIVANKQKMGRRCDRTKPINIKNKRPDLWPNFLAILEQHDQTKFNQVQTNIDSIIWFVDDLPYFAQNIIDQIVFDANQGLNQ